MKLIRKLNLQVLFMKTVVAVVFSASHARPRGERIHCKRAGRQKSAEKEF